MALRITLTYLGEPDPESTTVTLPIPNVGTLGRGVPHALTERVMAHFPGEEAEALAHRLADLYNRNQRLPRLRVGTTEVDESKPETETKPDTSTTDTTTAEGSAEQETGETPETPEIPETPQTDAEPATTPEPTSEPAPAEGDGSILDSLRSSTP